LKEDGAFFLVLLARLLCHRLVKKAVNEKRRGYVIVNNRSEGNAAVDHSGVDAQSAVRQSFTGLA
jgi:hypothetical protein